MTNEERLAQMPAVPEGSAFRLLKVDHVNYKPHPYHTSDRACFIEVDAQYDNLGDAPGLREYLKSAVDKATELGIDGFAFVKGQVKWQKYRVRITEYTDVEADSPEGAVKKFHDDLTRYLNDGYVMSTYVTRLEGEDGDVDEIEEANGGVVEIER